MCDFNIKCWYGKNKTADCNSLYTLRTVPKSESMNKFGYKHVLELIIIKNI